MVQAGDPLLEEYGTDGEPVRGLVDVNADAEVDDGIDGTGPSTGPNEQGSNRGAMNELRDMMADDMWHRYQISPWYRTS